MPNRLTTCCVHCGAFAHNIFTYCPNCGIDTGGYAECLNCLEITYQLDFGESGNACPGCQEHARELLLMLDLPKKRNRFQHWWQ